MSEAMKPCPFCGGRAEFDDCCDGGHRVMCSNCLVESPEPSYMSFLFETKKEAILAWNKRIDSKEITTLRAQRDQLQARVAELLTVCQSVQRDSKLRAEPDFDGSGAMVVNLSAGFWDELNRVIELYGDSACKSFDALILRKQADAIESSARRCAVKSMVGTYCYQAALDEEVQSLRRKADELESSNEDT